MANENVESYLQVELATAQRRLRIGTIALGVMAVLLIGYFTWIKSLVTEILEPENVAEVVAGELRRNLPGASAALQTTLVEASPDLVRFVMQQVVDGVLPAITDGVSEQLTLYAHEAARVGSEGVLTAFSATIKECKAARPARSKPGVEALEAHVISCVEKRYEAHLDTATESILGGKLSASAQALDRLNVELKSLASRRNLDRQDEIGKQLVTTWWSFLDRNHPEVSARDL
jgi:hypothetical protein